ncbi:MAG TPA: hypothetical protein DEQ02_08900 [Ruminococcaceae bacterium]|nr:hypothetical protein [Oscillospiraceae bacterium]
MKGGFRMLRFVIGRAGSGKTEFILEEISRKIRDNAAGMLLIVPEQYSFESERALLRRTGVSDAAKAEVLSFSRLCDRVFSEAGGIAGNRLDDGTRVLLMARVLRDLQKGLTIYKKQAAKPDFAAALLKLLSELKQNAVTPEILLKTADGIRDDRLQNKLTELSYIFAAYEKLAAERYCDPQEDLTRLRGALLGYPFFEGKQVYIDSFKGFTGQQAEILSVILRQAEDVTVALCCDGLQDNEQGLGLFSGVKEAAAELIDRAKREGQKIASPVVLTHNHRFKSLALAALAAGLFAPDAEIYEKEAREVTVCAAQTAYDECDFTARTIKQLVREQGYRYKEIAVIARDLTPYARLIKAAFERYNIPVHMDERVPAETLALSHLVLAALRAVLSGYKTDELLSYMKSELLDIGFIETARLEEYVFLWDIKGKRWLSPFTANPAGIGAQMDDAGRERLMELNNTREKLLSPLLRLERGIETTAQSISAALYSFLEDIGATEMTRLFAEKLRAGGETELSELQLRCWDVLMRSLNSMAVTLQGAQTDLREYTALFQMLIASQDMGSIPRGLDEAEVGAAGLMRPGTVRAVFVLGTNEGEFPAAPEPGGILSGKDRERLIEQGLKLNDRARREAVDESFLAYGALTAASERLYVSYKRSDLSGAVKEPSVIISQLKEILPKCTLRDEADCGIESAEAPEPAFALAAKQWNSGTALSAALKSYFLSHPDFAGRAAALESLTDTRPTSISAQTAGRLFGRRLSVSAAQAESYYRCPFSYFMKYGLGAKPRRAAKIDMMQRGSMMHHVLERMVTRHGGKGLAGLDPETASREIRLCLDEYVKSALAGIEDESGRIAYYVSRIALHLDDLIAYIGEDFGENLFEPALCEAEIGESGKIPPLTLKLPDGGSISVKGRIDRADTYEKDSVTYIRVIDYKNRGKSFSLADVLYGQNLQMLLYLFTLCENGSRLFGGNPVPAGVIYLPSSRVILDGRQAESEGMRKKKLSGLILDSTEAVDAMERHALGIFTPLTFTKSGGVDKRSPLTGPHGFDVIKRHIERLLLNMGTQLHGGKIPVSPTDGNSLPACAFCDYAAGCLRDCERETPKVPALKLTDALQRMEVERDGG